MKKSPGLEQQKEMNETKPVAPYEFSKNENLRYYFSRVVDARDQRGRRWGYFDDIDYETDYELNVEARNSYLRPKKNDDEVRINTGTTEKKIEATVNEILAMNLQPEIQAFDQQDLEIVDLGQDIGDVVKRTNQIEKDDDMWQEAVIELLTQRAVYVEELWIDQEIPNRSKNKKKKSLRRQYATKRVLNGLQIYPGDLSLPAYLFQKQPYVVKYERKTYDEAKVIYGDWENWQYVKPGTPGQDELGLNYKWRFGTILKNEVEIITFMDYPNDEYMIIINDVLMFDPAPLPWSYEGYNISCTNLKSLSLDFIYGKPLTASAKVLQSLDNEIIRNFIRKTRQSIEPPIGVAAGKVISKDSWSPAAVTQGLTTNDYTKLIDHQGVTNSEFAMMNLITQKIEEFIGASSVGNFTKKNVTATQINEQQKQALKMLGLAVYAVMRLKRDMTYLRINTILTEYIKPIDRKLNPITNKVENIYNSFTAHDSSLPDGRKGKKIINFSDRSLTPLEEDEIRRFEDLKEKVAGVPIRIKQINVKLLEEFPIRWYVNVTSQDRDTSALNKAMFTDQLNQANQLAKATQRQLNADTWIERMESIYKTKNLFQKPAPQTPSNDQGQNGQGNDVKGQAQAMLAKLQQMGGGQDGGGQGGSLVQVMTPSNPQKPSLNTLNNAG